MVRHLLAMQMTGVRFPLSALPVDKEDLEKRIKAQGEELVYLLKRTNKQGKDLMTIQQELQKVEDNVDERPISAEQNEA